MTSYSLLPLVVIFIYLLPVTIVLRSRTKRTRRLFLVYLAASIIWGLNSFLALATFSRGQLWLWSGLLPITGLWAVTSYLHLVSAFTKRDNRLWILCAYTALGILTIMAFTGYAPQVLQPAAVGGVSTDHGSSNTSVQGILHRAVDPSPAEEASSAAVGGVSIDYGLWLFLTLLCGAFFIGLSIFHLLRLYRTQENPLTQNRIIYFVLGAGLLAFLHFRLVVPPFQAYPLEHFGNLANVLMITYALLSRKLPDIRLTFRKYFVYLSVSALAAIFYVFVFWALHRSVNNWTTSISVAILAIAFITTLLLYPLIMLLQKFMDKFYYGKGYDYRQMMSDLGQQTKSILDLDQLAEVLLIPVTNATNAMQVSLLLPNDGHFTSQFTMRQIEGERAIPITLSKDGQIVRRLAARDGALSREVIEGALEFRRSSEPDRSAIKTAEIELLLPMKSKGRLIGILALSKRQWGGFYSDDDIRLLQTLVEQAAPALENAQLYAEARDRAHTDQLTGLLNHGYFHERIDEEISRCSRFGDVFSVMFMDLDYFKIYNDTHGHLAGDDVLRQIAQCIKHSTRGMDMAFRYGGDEFAIILPQAPLDDAHKIAERIRRNVEIEMDAKGTALTCSMGLASWPTDGVMRKDLLGAADAALYHSKQLGRNRISLAPEVVASEGSEPALDQEGDSTILSTIHALAATVDAKDHTTYGHSAKTSKYATELSKALGYTEEGIARIQAAALLHDIGKIRVSDALLVKRGPLSEDDWEPIREHPKLGVAILKHVKGLNGCLAAIRYHHEHYDGSGYPGGLKGEEIPLDARILAVADAYDAMTSPRPYRDDKLSHDEAIEELKRCAETHFDPEIIRIFAALWEPAKPADKEKKELKKTHSLGSASLTEKDEPIILVK